jgi:hypothetical protein
MPSEIEIPNGKAASPYSELAAFADSSLIAYGAKNASSKDDL